MQGSGKVAKGKEQAKANDQDMSGITMETKQDDLDMSGITMEDSPEANTSN
jgi:hypothetical protein